MNYVDVKEMWRKYFGLGYMNANHMVIVKHFTYQSPVSFFRRFGNHTDCVCIWVYTELHEELHSLSTSDFDVRDFLGFIEFNLINH